MGVRLTGHELLNPQLDLCLLSLQLLRLHSQVNLVLQAVLHSLIRTR